MSNYLMGFGGYGATAAIDPTAPTAMVEPSSSRAVMTTSAETTMPTYVRIEAIQQTVVSSYIKQKVAALRAILIDTRSSDPLNVCQQQSFVDSFHPMGFTFGCASQQVRFNGTPFRDAVRAVMWGMKQREQMYGDEPPASLVIPLAHMVSQESDMSAGDATKYIAEDLQQVGGATQVPSPTQVTTVPSIRQPTRPMPPVPEDMMLPGDTMPAPGIPDPGAHPDPGLAPSNGTQAADIAAETTERAEDAQKKYLLWGLFAGSVIIGGYYLFFGRNK